MSAMIEAQRLLDAFVKDTRTDGEEFWKVEGTREPGNECWRDLIFKIHGNMMPDDTKYRMIRECLQALVDRDEDDWDDSLWEIADNLVDVYNVDRLRWVSSHLLRADYCDEALETNGKPDNLFYLLGWGQCEEYEEILRYLVDGLREIAEEFEDEEEAR